MALDCITRTACLWLSQSHHLLIDYCTLEFFCYRYVTLHRSKVSIKVVKTCSILIGQYNAGQDRPLCLDSTSQNSSAEFSLFGPDSLSYNSKTKSTLHAVLKKESSPFFRSFFVPSECANYYACLLWVIYNMTFSNRLIQETLASYRTAETGNAIVAAVLALEFVVIRKLVVCVLC
jgi:hypothetical protein